MGLFIGIFLLNLLGQQYDTKNIGLYRDDVLSIFKNCSGLQMEKIKKRLQKIFENNQYIYTIYILAVSEGESKGSIEC